MRFLWILRRRGGDRDGRSVYSFTARFPEDSWARVRPDGPARRRDRGAMDDGGRVVRLDDHRRGDARRVEEGPGDRELGRDDPTMTPGGAPTR